MQLDQNELLLVKQIFSLIKEDTSNPHACRVGVAFNISVPDQQRVRDILKKAEKALRDQ